jgi:prepilin-type processing-associated H-X9-DG protein
MRRRVEALVLLAMLLVGAGLVLGLVAGAQEAAGRTSCLNNLRALALAVQSYHGAENRFPSGTVPNERLSPERRFSWYVELWPYVQAGPRLPFDQEKPWDAEENLITRLPWQKEGKEYVADLGSIPYLLCPANQNLSPAESLSLTHYVGIAGLGRQAATLPLTDPAAGFFGYDRVLRLDDLRAGGANTLVAVETAWDNGPWTAGGYPTVRGLEPGGRYFGQGRQFGGTHRGGTNALFADGSARLLSDDMDLRSRA